MAVVAVGAVVDVAGAADVDAVVAAAPVGVVVGVCWCCCCR